MKKFIALAFLTMPYMAHGAIYTSTATLFEFNPAGSNNYGGGFDSTVVGAGTDYSTYTTLVASSTALTTTAGSAVITSTAPIFTSDMVGNMLHITAGATTGMNPGFYMIIGYTNPSTITVDRSADLGTGGSAGIGYVGGSLAVFASAICSSVPAGGHVYVKNNGIMALTGNTSFPSGNTTSYITIEGYNATRGDAPIGSDRPTIGCGSSSLSMGSFIEFKNFIATGTGTTLVVASNYGRSSNIKAMNTSGTAARVGFSGGSYGFQHHIEAVSTYGYGISLTNIYQHNDSIYIHNCGTGVYASGSACYSKNVIISSCVAGIVFLSATYFNDAFANSIIFNCSTGIVHYSTANFGCKYYNTIISSCGTGIYSPLDGVSKGTQQSIFMENNIWWENATDRVGVSSPTAGIYADPLLNDPYNGDFTLRSGSPALNSALGPDTTMGLVGTYKQNIGADQGEHAATTTSGGTRAYIFTQ
jgi:hypothetical protein